jgi:hypothetical protein
MRTSAKTRYFFLTALLTAAALMLACSLLANPGSKTTSEAGSDGSTPAVAEGEVPVSEGSEKDDPLDHLLDLRSVHISLAAEYPDGSNESQVIEVDSAGNVHTTVTPSIPTAEYLPEGFDPAKLAGSYELYMLNGKTYQSDPTDPAWVTKTLEEDYKQTLNDQLHGPSGPGLWLDILPENSITKEGSETIGGFVCDRYKVNGTVDDQAITGTIWVDPDAFAIIKTELHVPAALLAATDKPTTGELKVTLNVEKADVPAVKLPAAPAGGEVQPTATP